MSNIDDIKHITNLMRTSTDPMWTMVRNYITQQGVDPSTAILTDSFEDDENCEFGVVVDLDRQIYTYAIYYDENHEIDTINTTWQKMINTGAYHLKETFDYLETGHTI